jgi:hypothetical protein
MDHLQAIQTTYRTSTLGSADITSDNAQAPLNTRDVNFRIPSASLKRPSQHQVR